MKDEIAAVEPSLEIDHEFDVIGAKLSKMTQAIAYKGIREMRPIVQRSGARIQIERIKEAVAEVNKIRPTSAVLWKTIGGKGVSKPA
ncbi:hypothetical protein DFS33DRAFT_1368222 [Desarmillaria ectypa]|nr:hypothetical protein DFS33DRAFT_1368222 [Desarmillaria ectypa]